MGTGQKTVVRTLLACALLGTIAIGARRGYDLALFELDRDAQNDPAPGDDWDDVLLAGNARAALLEAVRAEGNPCDRALACFALSFYADPRDVEPIVAAMRENRIASLMGTYALALAFHGGEGAFPALLGVLRDRDLPGAARAAGIGGAALFLEEDPLPILHRVTRESNYLADPELVGELLKFLM